MNVEEENGDELRMEEDTREKMNVEEENGDELRMEEDTREKMNVKEENGEELRMEEDTREKINVEEGNSSMTKGSSSINAYMHVHVSKRREIVEQKREGDERQCDREGGVVKRQAQRRGSLRATKNYFCCSREKEGGERERFYLFIF